MTDKHLEILYNGCFCGEDIFELIVKNQEISMSYAQEKLEKMIFKGSEMNNINVTAISSVPARAYPGNKILWWKYRRSSLNNHVTLIQLAFLNLLGLKHLMFFIGSFFETIIWCIKHRKNKNKAMLSYSTNPPVLLPMLYICKLFGVKSFVLVSEIPKLRFFDGQSSFVRSVLLKMLTSVSTFLHEQFSGYILITEMMNKMINKGKKPYLVCEGMIDIDDIDDTAYETKQSKKIILYTGSLNAEYGFKALVESFKGLNIEDIELVFCGQGSFTEELIEETKIDKRIKYMGMLSYKDVLKLQREASFLINPRPTNHIFTKYSFPSKTLEYLLTETPVISTKLSGIPDEYHTFLNYIEDESITGISERLSTLFKLDYSELKATAVEGRKFVVETKNIKAQTGRIFSFINKSIKDTFL